MQGVFARRIILAFYKGKISIKLAFAPKEWGCFFAAGYHFLSHKSLSRHQERP